MTVAQLKQMGFTHDPTVFEDEFSYDTLYMRIKEHTLMCTIEYDSEGKYRLHYYEFNEVKTTKQDLTIEDINLLKSIL